MSTRHLRIVILWACIGLFLLRVLGQIEVVLTAPTWLPPMEQWYSGLLPYPLLLPAQILILMLMTGVTVNEMRRPYPARRDRLRQLALIYFGAMVLRLIIQFSRGAEDVIAAGGIPVAFHWVLALFLLVLSRSRAIDRPYGVVERVQ